MPRTTTDWLIILLHCQVNPAKAHAWAPVFSDVVNAKSFSLGDDELDDFLGQILHESFGLTRLVEDMNYSAQRLTEVWPRRFPTLADARPYANNPEALANRVYGGRMGNAAPGDGWRYRARAPVGITGKANYLRVGELMGQDLDVNPELLEQPRFALEAAILWWEDRIPDSLIGDPEKVTERVNGALIGLADRERRSALAQKALA